MNTTDERLEDIKKWLSPYKDKIDILEWSE
jgi:hypothetical protein